MHTWQWHTSQGRSYLTCSLLDAWPHGFFSRQWESRYPEEMVTALAQNAPVYRVKQIHGNRVLTPSEVAAIAPLSDTPDDSAKALAEADGLLTEQPGQAVWVATADCVPALIADIETGQVAAVHAGWRGTAQAIVPEAIRRLRAQGSQLKHLRVALGPAIAGECYQVSITVAAQVGATVVAASIPSPKRVATSTRVETATSISNTEDIVLEQLAQLSPSPLLEDAHPDRVRLDIRQVNRLQLEQIGLEPDQIAIAPFCTYQHADHFFSYRRNPVKKVQWSGIVSRG